MSKDKNTQTGAEATSGTAKATGGHGIVLPGTGEETTTVANAVSDRAETPNESVYKAFQAERNRMLAAAKDRSLLSDEEKKIGVENIKRFLLVSLSFTAQGKSVLADGEVSMMEAMASLNSVMMQMPTIKQIEFAQIYVEFKDLDDEEIEEVLLYLQERGKAVGLDKTGLLRVAEATFQALGYLKIAAEEWGSAFEKK